MHQRFVALLRGINVGGKNKLAMKDLVRMFESSGCVHVRNYIQSGNVVFEAPLKVVQGLPDAITREIAKQFGHQPPVLLRSLEQMEAVIRGNPFVNTGVAESELHVVFLSAEPSAAAVATLDSGRSSPDEFVVHGQEIYLRLPKGTARSKLTNSYFDSKLKTVSTVRNWRTATTLLEMMKS